MFDTLDGLDDFVRLDEKFQFHLLEFARAEGEIARRDFVAKRLADLRDAERHFLPRRFQNIFELRENRLRGFGTEISNAVIAFNRTDESFEHQIERTWQSKFDSIFWIIFYAVFDFLCFDYEIGQAN